MNPTINVSYLIRTPTAVRNAFAIVCKKRIIGIRAVPNTPVVQLMLSNVDLAAIVLAGISCAMADRIAVMLPMRNAQLVDKMTERHVRRRHLLANRVANVCREHRFAMVRNNVRMVKMRWDAIRELLEGKRCVS